MSSGSLDPFEDLAAECGLLMTAETVYSAPRDVVHAPEVSDQCFLVTLRTRARESTLLTIVFQAPFTQLAPPAYRDVLWWLAADGWALREANGILQKWAMAYGYPVDDPATTRLFETHVRAAAELTSLLGMERYRRLLALYGAEVSSRDRA